MTLKTFAAQDHAFEGNLPSLHATLVALTLQGNMLRTCHDSKCDKLRNTPSTAGNSMTGSGRPSPEPLLRKEASPAGLEGENSGNALEPSNALNYRAWGIPAVLSKGMPGKALRAFPGSFRNFSGISSGKSQPYWGYGPQMMIFIDLLVGLFRGAVLNHDRDTRKQPISLNRPFSLHHGPFPSLMGRFPS